MNNNALVLASSILNPDHETNQKHPTVGEVIYMKRFDTEIVDIHIFRQGIIRLSPDIARELIKELNGIGITGEDV